MATVTNDRITIRALAVALLMTLAIPAAAGECATATVTWAGTTPIVEDRHGAEGIRFDFVGLFVQWTVTDEERLTIGNYDLDLSSEEIPADAETVKVCVDGVTFTTGERVEEAPTPEIPHVIPIEHFEYQRRNLAHGGVYPI